jgi:toxin FitB
MVLEWFGRQTAVAFFTTAITKSEIMVGIALPTAGRRRDTLADIAEKMFREDFSGLCLAFDESCANP